MREENSLNDLCEHNGWVLLKEAGEQAQASTMCDANEDLIEWICRRINRMDGKVEKSARIGIKTKVNEKTARNDFS